MVFNATFNNMSVISWRSVLLVEETGVTEENHRASSAVDRGFEFRSGQTKDYKIGICYFSAKHAALTRKSKEGLARNHDNVSEWGNMSIQGLLFQ
jgi:hypothetical protein